ncbi:MAG: sugar nucleotide-binding protein [Thermoplasmata archaeon]|nr:sugar nucleotide-binding protein [Thermoplasmata archaeon]
MTDVLVFGADSLVGSHYAATATRAITAAGRVDPRTVGLRVAGFRPVELDPTENVERMIREAPEPVVVNFAASTDVDAVERQRPAASDPPEVSPAFRVNALAPEAMARATHASGKQLITLSTDFVFDGIHGPYREDAHPGSVSAAISWYGWTKAEGERRVRAADPSAAIVRVAYPYRARFSGKLDFARRLVAHRRSGTLPPLFTDQTITPTWIPDVSRAIDHLIDRRASGTFHAASPEATTPHAFALELFTQLEGTPPKLAEGSVADFLRRPGAIPRPQHGGLIGDRLATQGVALTSWVDGIQAFLREGGGT